MTTICASDTEMACDSQITDDALIVPSNEPKIFRLSDGSIVGFSGDAEVENKLFDWFENGIRPNLPEGAEFSVLQLTRWGIYKYDDSLDCYYEVSAPEAIGSGAGYAIAAMKCGKTPRQAVKVASEIDIYTGGRTHSLKLKRSSS